MRSLRGPQRVGAVCLCQLRIDVVEGAQVRGQRRRITAGHRTGECGLAAPQGVLQRRPGQWSDDTFGESAGGIADEFLTQQFLTGQRRAQCGERVGDQGDDCLLYTSPSPRDS